MLSKIIRYSIANKLIIGILVLALIGLGMYDFTRLPIDAVPDITNNQVQVITVAPSTAAPEVERLITFPIEQSVTSIPGIIEMRSFSRFGLSLVTIVFNDNTDIYWARQQVSEKLSQVKDQIPADAGRPELAPVTTGLGEIFQYAVRPAKGFEGKYTAMELRTIQDWIVRRQLLGTPGVADVSSFGGYLKQYEVSIVPDKLKSLGVSINDVFQALQKNNQNTGGTYIEKGPNILFIRSEGLARNLDEIGKIVVKHTSVGMPVYIRDLAKVQLGHSVRYGAMCFNDEGEVAGAVVMMLKGANSSKVILDVKEKIRQIEKTLPEGVLIEPFLDRTKMVNNAIGTVKSNLLEGALIVIFILVLFLGNIRAGLIVASVIPLAMLFAIIMMNLFGVSGNLMSLGALDFGLIVDGAVIIVEAVMHRLYHSRHFATVNLISQEQMNQEVEHSAGKMMSSAVFGQIIILIVYLPILSLVGIEGKMFKPMAQTVSFALVGAFILSLTYVPMVSSLLLNKKLSHKDTWADKMMRLLENAYQPALDLALRFPKMLVSSALVVFLLAAYLITTIGGEFIPELEEGDFAVDTRVLTGSSLTNTIEATQKTAHVLLTRFPEVQKVVTKIGSGEIPTDPMPVDASDMMVILKDKSEWTSAKSFDELANKMSKALEDIPGVTAGFQFPVQMRFNELMTGARQDVVCKIFGEDLDSLSLYADKLGGIIRTVSGAKDLYVETVTGLPQIVVEYDRDALARFQLNIEDVNKVIQTAFAGQSAGMIYENERRFDLVVRMDASHRSDLSDVGNLLIPTPMGTQILLSSVAKVSIKEGPNQIQREDAKRRIIVGFNVRGRDVQSIVDELEKKVNTQLKFSPGYYVTYGGQFENLVQAKARLSVAVPVALLLIFIMLYFAFGKLKYGVLIFSAIPLSAIGGILALWLRSMPFSISAGIGFIALFGVAVLNGIVLIAEFNRLKEQGLHDLRHIVMEGTKVRLRPVLMTASVASLGFLPMALSNGAGAEVQRPLATVVIGGLITATLLTLLLLPVLYMWIEKEKKPRKKNKYGIAVLLALFSFYGSMAQVKSLSLDEMIKLGIANNKQLKATRQSEMYWKEISKAPLGPPPLQSSFEYGKINSVFNDTKLSFGQSFQLPIVYKRQKELVLSELKGAQYQSAARELDLKRDIKSLYYSLQDLHGRMYLLQSMDTIFSKWAKAAALRYQAGESNLLESTTAKSMAEQLSFQRNAVQLEIESLEKSLGWMLGSTDLKITEDVLKNAKAPIPADFLNALPPGHPLLEYSRQFVAIAEKKSATEKSGLLPETSLGFLNQSIKGWQTSDGVVQKYYGSGHRFNSVVLGVSVPIFSKAVKARWNASKLEIEKAKLELTSLEQQLNIRLDKSLKEFKRLSEQLRYFETTGLDQSRLIEQHAEVSFYQGELGFLEWTQLMQQSMNLKTGYLDALKAYNDAVVEIEYLLGN